jgi:rhodanese-related sulfurtransferase
MNDDARHLLEVDCLAVKQLLDDHQPLTLLDCREQDEYEYVHLEGAKLIPMHELPQRLGELGDDTARRVIVYCHHGQRSLMVAQWLRAQGWRDAQSMAGGIDAWSLHIDPTRPRY